MTGIHGLGRRRQAVVTVWRAGGSVTLCLVTFGLPFRASRHSAGVSWQRQQAGGGDQPGRLVTAVAACSGVTTAA